jgi:Zn-dependent protease/CBS domain-containing protein
VDQRTGDARQDRPPVAERPPGTLRIGRIAGVDVLVRSSWLLVAALISVMYAPDIERVEPGLGAWKYVVGLGLAVLLYLSVLLHEASHALMAQRYGLPVSSITLHFLGGVTEIEGEPRTPRQEFGVSVVGPLTSLAVGGAALGLFTVMPDGLLRFAMFALAFTNLVVGVLNLVPGLPLDGGRVLRALVWQTSGDPHQATLVAGWGGRVFAAVAIGYPLVASLVLGRTPSLSTYLVVFIVAAFLWSGSSAAIASARVRRRLPSLHAHTLARRAIAVPHDLPLAEALRRAQEAQAGGIVVVDSTGSPSAIVSESAVLATPQERRPWLPVSAVARTVESGISLPADISGEPLIMAMQRSPASEYLLLDRDGSVFGVLVADDVDRAFAAGA